MADTAAAEAATPPGKRSPLITVLVLAAALAVGGGLGLFVVGPMLAKAPSAASAEAAGTGHEGGEAARPLVFSIDGVIVNPAGSRGQHHLIATVAWQVGTPADEEKLRGAEIPLRDAVGSLLERKTLEALTEPGIRDVLREELRRLVEPYVGDRVVQVYLPQLIVQ